jgi:hypothetical protein
MSPVSKRQSPSTHGSLPVETPPVTAKMTAGMLGGMIGPMIEDAPVIAKLKSSS